MAAIGERGMRERAAGKRPVEPWLADWLRALRRLFPPPSGPAG